MLGLTPAVWITEATVPRPDAVSNSAATACRSVTSQLTTVGVIPRSFSVAAAASSRSCLTSARTTAWSRPTTLAVASTHATRATRDYRHSTHIWTVYGECCQKASRVGFEPGMLAVVAINRSAQLRPTATTIAGRVHVVSVSISVPSARRPTRPSRLTREAAPTRTDAWCPRSGIEFGRNGFRP